MPEPMTTPYTSVIRISVIALAALARLDAQTFTLGDVCSYSVNLLGNITFAQNSSGQVAVTPSDASCGWVPSVIAGAAWFSAAATPGQQNSLTVTATVGNSNTGIPRTGAVQVENRVLRFTQSAEWQYSGGFVDVADDRATSPGQSWYNNIVLMKQYGITDGCDTTIFCPSDPLRKEQIAVFLARAVLYPNGNTTAYTQQPYFEDVPSTYYFFPAIQRLADLGLAKDCGNGYYTNLKRFCPLDNVTRGEMAEMVIKGLYRNQAWSYPSAPYFPGDVSIYHPQFSYIQKMGEQGITPEHRLELAPTEW